MSKQTQETYQCDLIAQTPKTPEATRFYSKFPIGLITNSADVLTCNSTFPQKLKRAQNMSY